MATAKLSTKSVGDIVKLKFNGVRTNFIVVHQGIPSTSIYDSSCNGTWLLMENLYGEAKGWGTNGGDYTSSYMYSTSSSSGFQKSFLNGFEEDVKNNIKSVKIPYVKKTESGTSELATGSNGCSTKAFSLSIFELGNPSSYCSVEGAVLDYFKTDAKNRRIAKLNGTARDYWTRSTSDGLTSRYSVGSKGEVNAYANSNKWYVRPAFILPNTFEVEEIEAAIIGNITIGSTTKELTGEGYVNIGGVSKSIVETYNCIDGIWKQST